MRKPSGKKLGPCFWVLMAAIIAPEGLAQLLELITTRAQLVTPARRLAVCRIRTMTFFWSAPKPPGRIT